MDETWNLYVWRDVLCDYTCGMAFAIAPNLETAIATVCEGEWFTLSTQGLTITSIADIKAPVGAYVCGGG